MGGTVELGGGRGKFVVEGEGDVSGDRLVFGSWVVVSKVILVLAAVVVGLGTHTVSFPSSQPPPTTLSSGQELHLTQAISLK